MRPQDRSEVAKLPQRETSVGLESNIISIHLHDSIETEVSAVEGFAQMLSWQLETFPDAQKVVMHFTEDVCLPACVSAKTLKLERTDCEWGDHLVAALSKPALGSPIQELEGAPHLLLK